MKSSKGHRDIDAVISSVTNQEKSKGHRDIHVAAVDIPLSTTKQSHYKRIINDLNWNLEKSMLLSNTMNLLETLKWLNELKGIK